MLSLPAFAGVAFVVIITPGPDTAITVRNTLAGGRSAGIASAFGVGCGQLVWVVATSIGILALLNASRPLFFALKLVGAAYLVFLGLRALRDALRPAAVSTLIAANGSYDRLGPPAAFRQGLLSNLGNPKIAVFYASILPQVAPPLGSTAEGLLLLGVIFASVAAAWLTIYAVLIPRFGDVLRRGAVQRWIEGVAGIILVGLGMALAFER
jgi:threonine/homoserine/homoserine lactone efflux protein